MIRSTIIDGNNQRSAGALLVTASGMAANSSKGAGDMHKHSAYSLSVSPEPSAFDHGVLTVGERVRYVAPGHDWDGELGTVVPPIDYLISGTVFVAMDNPKLNGSFGFTATRRRFLARVEETT